MYDILYRTYIRTYNKTFKFPNDFIKDVPFFPNETKNSPIDAFLVGSRLCQGVSRAHQRVQVTETPAVLLQLIQDRLLDVTMVEPHVQCGLTETRTKHELNSEELH